MIQSTLLWRCFPQVAFTDQAGKTVSFVDCLPSFLADPPTDRLEGRTLPFTLG